MSSQSPLDPSSKPVESRVAIDLPAIFVAPLGRDCEAYEELSHTAFLRSTAAHGDVLWRRQHGESLPFGIRSAATPLAEPPDISIEAEALPAQVVTERARLLAFSVSREPTGWRIELFVSTVPRMAALMLLVLVMLAVMGTIGVALQFISQFSF